jgi:pimeloyl-ACP methyl ester carboxylesterase
MAKTKMWLRDFLPGNAPFNKARIMTFGYNSTLVDRKSNDRLQDWADELLRQLGGVRDSPAERARPLVLVCHSMGGIVGRQAMVRLHALPKKFSGVQLDKCGLLFLSTPHSGSKEADWSEFLVSVLDFTIGLRSKEIVDQLRAFNPFSVDSTEAFTSMNKIPPFYCLVEGDKTKKAGKNRTVGLAIPSSLSPGLTVS